MKRVEERKQSLPGRRRSATAAHESVLELLRADRVAGLERALLVAAA
jgi:hypothetical protein